MSILEHPTAQALLEQATVTPAQVRDLAGQLQDFLAPYLPLFQRREQGEHAARVLQGKLSGLERKTSEPIANEAGVHRKPVQAFVGWAPWDDEAITAELRRHVAREWADPEAVLVLDPSGFPKKGTESCGVARQWCGRLGKVDNCQVGLFLAYACRHGHTLVDRRLFLPKQWARDRQRRRKTHVPKGTRYRERWQIGLGLVDRATDLPHGWVTADSELGRVAAFRAGLRRRRKRYLVEVPASTLVRDLEAPPPRRRGATGRKPKGRFVGVENWARAQPRSAWQRFEVRAGEKGPLQVEVLTCRVQTRQDNRVGPEERLVVVRSLGPDGRTWYKLSPAGAPVPEAELARVHGEHHRVEQSLQEGKGEVGLGQYEVRSWVGWHHHMTLSLLALWFLALQRQRGGEKDAGADGVPGAADRDAPAAAAAADVRANRRGGQPRAAA
jgi:SRSO17 transposase